MPHETALRRVAASLPPGEARRPSPELPKMAMAPPARSYAARSQFSLIASAEAAPLPRAVAPIAPRKPFAEPVHTPEMPRSRPKMAPGSRGARGRLYIQAGAFLVPANARRAEVRIAPLGSVRVTAAAINGFTIYRVRLGPVKSRQQADRLLQRVVGSGCPGAQIVID
jgi:peptidoglycan lytic transglycosylase